MRFQPSLSTLVIGVSLDGPVHPDIPSASSAAAFEAVLGPAGLVAAVEQTLGLTAPLAPPSQRLARWRTKMAAADTGTRFWSKSFGLDPLATARSLLAWRDQLVTAGWTPAQLTAPPPRFADMAATEMAGPPMVPGFADRIMAASAALEMEGVGTPIEQIRLLEPRSLLPPGLARLIDALERSGTVIEPIALTQPADGGDLSTVQAMLQRREHGGLIGDGSFAILTAESEPAAAEILADWLGHARGELGETVIVAEQRTAILDAGLRRRRLPRLGVGAPSALRGLLQVLPLALALRWRPFDPWRALELLQLPGGPIPRAVAGPLVNLLTDVPGRGGPRWRGALDTGWAIYAARAGDDAQARQREQNARRRVGLLIDAPLNDPVDGVTVAELMELTSVLASWSMARAQQGVKQATALAAACTDLAVAARETGLARIGRLELERLLDEVLVDGCEDPELPAEAAAWNVVRRPAAVWGHADTVVWWTLAMPGLPRRSPWSAAELKALADAGCPLGSAADALALADMGWRRPLISARRRVVLVTVAGAGADRAATHPLLHELQPLLKTAPSSVMVRAEAVLGDPRARFNGAILPRVNAAPLNPPSVRRDWSLPAGITLRRRQESASSLETLLGCPYKWVAEYLFGLRPGRRAQVPDGEQLAGTLAHRLVQLLLAPGQPADPATIEQQAIARLPALVDEEAAPLRAAGAAAELARVQRVLPKAIGALAQIIQQQNLTIDSIEEEITGADMPEPGETFIGTLDLLLRGARSAPVVIDLKWSRRDRWRREQLQTGHAVQLAAYARMVAAGEAAGYFMLAQQRLLARPGGLLPGSLEGPTLADTWVQAIESRRARLAALGQGKLHALWMDPDGREAPPDPDGAALAPQPPCRFCHLGRLCGQEPAR